MKPEPEPSGGPDSDPADPPLQEPKLTFPEPLPESIPASIPDLSPQPTPSAPAKLYRPAPPPPPPPEPPSRTWIWIASGIAAGILLIVYGLLMMTRREEAPPPRTAEKPEAPKTAKAPPTAPEAETPKDPPVVAPPVPTPAPPPAPVPVAAQTSSASSAPPALAPPKGADGSPSVAPADPVAVRVSTADALKPLLEQLQDANPNVRNEACLAIERLGSDATEAIPSLRASLIDPDKRVRQSAYRALRIQHDVSIDVWTEAMHNPDPDIRLLVLEVLPFYKELGVAPLIGSFRDKVDAIRIKAAERLAALPGETPGLMASLQTALRDSEIPVRQAAAHAFSKMPPGAAKPAVPALAAALSDPDVAVRTSAGDALGRVPESAKLAVEALSVSLRDRDPAIRARAAKALAAVGPRALDAAPLLIDLLNEEDLTVREEVSKTLRGMKNVSPPLLFKALQSKDVRAQDWARLDLINRGEETAKAVAAELPKMKTREDRYKLVRILTEQKDKAVDAVPVLLKHLKTSDEGLKEASADSLVRIGPALAPYVTELAKLLDDKNPTVKERIGMTLRGIGPAAAAAAPQLVRTFKSGDLKISVFTDIMAGIGEEAVPSLIGGLHDANPDVREGCASALGRIGPAALKAVSALNTMLKKEQDREAKTAAQNALKIIQGR